MAANINTTEEKQVQPNAQIGVSESVVPSEIDLASPATPDVINNPDPNMPPQSLTDPALNPGLTGQPQNQMPAPQMPGVTNTSITTGGSRSGGPKKVLFALLALGLLGALVAIVIGVVLPRLRGGSVGSTELVWWGLWEDDSIINPIIEEYQLQNPGITIKYEKQSKEDYRDRLVNSMARGDAPDIFRIHNTWVPMFKNQLSVLPSNVMSPEEFTSTFYPVAVDDFNTTKGIVAIPLEYDGLGLFINEEIFSTYGATIPKTWNELRETAKGLTIKDDKDVIKQSGVSLGKTKNVDHWQEIVGLMLLQNGADLSTFSGDSTERALKFFQQFSELDGVWDETLPTSTIAFATGQLAMYVGPSWRAFEVIEQNPSLRFKVVSIPQITTDPQDPDITYASYWAESIWDKSKSSLEAWKFLKYLSSRESLTKLYENSSRIRKFGEPYPRQDMRDLLLSDPIVGGFVELAPSAKSWYLASRTFDGETGINTSLSGYFEDVFVVRPGGNLDIDTLSVGVRTVLSRYGLAAPPPVEE